MAAAFVTEMNASDVSVKVPMRRSCWSLDDVILEQGSASPSSATTAIPSDEGSTHDESSSSAPAGEADSDADENEEDFLKSPSKSARRRMRRRRQRDAMLESARLRDLEVPQHSKEAWHCGQAPAPICTTPMAAATHCHSPASTMVPNTPDAMSFPSTPLSTQDVVSPMAPAASVSSPTRHFGYGVVPASPACCSTPSSILSAPASLAFNVMSTSPCNGMVIRGDAACRSPVGAMPAAAQPQCTYMAAPFPAAACPAVPTHFMPGTVGGLGVAPPMPPMPVPPSAPAAQPAQSPVASPPAARDPVLNTLRSMLGYDITMDTRENMAAKLRAAAFDVVYED